MHAKTIGRWAGIAWLAVAFVVANTTSPFAVGPAAATDAVSNAKAVSVAYQNQAQAYLDRFYAFTLSSASLGGARARVQVSMNGTTFWAKPTSVKDRTYRATLFEDGPAGSEGDVIEFKKENVLDWSFQGRNKLYYGEFQRRAEMALLSREEAANLGVMLTASAVPPGW
ncbi:MAG: hypothetical protein ABJF50_19880 [Paracoccaceae bacterium]